ncbi:MAG: hypothetical protein IT552_02010 [Sphingomonadaceae bacterium]|nr:hypothetical protein [Sphingomonadaceae bacterium]
MSKLQQEQDRICPPHWAEMVGILLFTAVFAIAVALNMPEPAAEDDVAAMRVAVVRWPAGDR